MSLPVVLKPAAERDVESAAAWHEDWNGSALRFVAQVREVLDRIGRMPEAHVVVYRDVRRARVLRSAYNVYYRVMADRIEILAVVDGRRDASAWQTRI